MTKYMYLFRGGDEGMSEMSPEESEANMNLWKAWMGQLAEAGKLLGGEPLHGGGKIVRNGGEIITDGPFMEGKEVVGGYLMMNVESLDEAVELSKECPIFKNGGFVEVRQVMDM